jgi:hypothetical protein
MLLLHRLASAAVPTAWIASFAWLALTGQALTPPPLWNFLALAAAGFIYCHLACRAALSRLFRQHGVLLAALLGLSAAIAASEAAARIAGMPRLPPFLPAQIGLPLCAAPLAIFLMDAGRMRGLALLFLAICAWHFVAMPIEAVTGAKLTWHALSFPMPRSAGPLHFQASGLALVAFTFVGLFGPMLYLAAGPLFEHRLLPGRHVSPGAIEPLSWAWLIPCACVQSRSLFAGAAAAALFYFAASRGKGHARHWLVAGGLALAGIAAYWYLFNTNKSGAALRWAYLTLYWREATAWPWIVFGRGLSYEMNPAMLVPGMSPIVHSHNDIVQMLYAWGAGTLLAYAVVWYGLLKLVWCGFVAHRKYWPVCALLVAVPGMVTDLGFELYEKAVFLVILAAFCMALAPASARVAPAADAQPATP